MRVKEESQWREKEKGFLEHIKVAFNSRVAKQGLGSIAGAVRTLAMFMVDFLFYFIFILSMEHQPAMGALCLDAYKRSMILLSECSFF